MKFFDEKRRILLHFNKNMSQNFWDIHWLKNFYQYILNKNDVIKSFNNFRFKLKYIEPFGGLKGFKDEIFTH